MTARLRIWALAGLWAAGGAAAAAVWVRCRLFAVTVEGHSMSPALRPGDRVLMRRGARGLRVGSLVVVDAPDPVTGWDPAAGLGTDPAAAGRFVKRVAALGGRPYPPELRRGGTVPDGHVIVLGDNPHSVDSKQYGPCPVTRVQGVGVRSPFTGRTVGE